jgi:hypothetical protein
MNAAKWPSAQSQAPCAQCQVTIPIPFPKVPPEEPTDWGRIRMIISFCVLALLPLKYGFLGFVDLLNLHATQAKDLPQRYVDALANVARVPLPYTAQGEPAGELMNTFYAAYADELARLQKELDQVPVQKLAPESLAKDKATAVAEMAKQGQRIQTLFACQKSLLGLLANTDAKTAALRDNDNVHRFAIGVVLGYPAWKNGIDNLVDYEIAEYDLRFGLAASYNQIQVQDGHLVYRDPAERAKYESALAHRKRAENQLEHFLEVELPQLKAAKARLQSNLEPAL